MNANSRPRIDYTNKDYASLREAMLQLAREKLPTGSYTIRQVMAEIDKLRTEGYSAPA